ncbi:Imm26 family immunity protein [Paenibacillus allorhizosphaerae]|uniref:YopX protein domain-containing protein n=1 Tax=Paenibacillus allorhizosphaerae TaxID=2849866 RepID=A0ABM8VU15_9BACL|nr:Imm26 family immunity protein [Paenibacillus allorhizosphaerae]CAG7658521.1 hypothetical protein PAECIP111802_07065 [Paenibacillus allorhizosphaerae]
MSKKYKLGDVFRFSTEKTEIIAYGRITMLNRPSILIEIFNTEINGKTDFSKLRPVMTVWATDTGLKKGVWEIIDNLPVNPHYEEPKFIRHDAFTGKLMIVDGNEVYEANDDNTHGAQPFGIFGDVAVEKRFLHELNK